MHDTFFPCCIIQNRYARRFSLRYYREATPSSSAIAIRGIAIERSASLADHNPLKFHAPFLISIPKGDVDIDMPSSYYTPVLFYLGGGSTSRAIYYYGTGTHDQNCVRSANVTRASRPYVNNFIPLTHVTEIKINSIACSYLIDPWHHFTMCFAGQRPHYFMKTFTSVNVTILLIFTSKKNDH